MNDFENPPLRSERREDAYGKELTQHVLTTLTGNLSAPLRTLKKPCVFTHCLRETLRFAYGTLRTPCVLTHCLRETFRPAYGSLRTQCNFNEFSVFTAHAC